MLQYQLRHMPENKKQLMRYQMKQKMKRLMKKIDGDGSIEKRSNSNEYQLSRTISEAHQTKDSRLKDPAAFFAEQMK